MQKISKLPLTIPKLQKIALTYQKMYKNCQKISSK